MARRLDSPIVRLAELSEEISAGYGAAAVSVRTLDRVSLSIGAREMLIVQGGVASGATSLVAAVLGARRGSAIARQGHRHVAAAVQIRRGTIDRAAFLALHHAWITSVDDDVGTHRDPHAATACPLYVLRVRAAQRDGLTSATALLASWRAWVGALRARGGSVLVHTTTAQNLWVTAHYPSIITTPHGEARQVHERGDPPWPRVISCDSGRVLSAADRRSADEPPASCDPYPTASPES